MDVVSSRGSVVRKKRSLTRHTKEVLWPPNTRYIISIQYSIFHLVTTFLYNPTYRHILAANFRYAIAFA